MTSGRKKVWKPVEPPVLDEGTIREYAETHSPEQTAGYLDGIKAMYECISYITIPRDKDGFTSPRGVSPSYKKLINFVRHKMELLDNYFPEDVGDNQPDNSPSNSDATLTP